MAASRSHTIKTDGVRVHPRADRLYERFGAFLSPQIHRRGVQLYGAGFVQIIGTESDFIMAWVTDKRRFEVDLWYEDDDKTFYYECDCSEYRRRHEVSPHVWAVLLTFELDDEWESLPADAVRLVPGDDEGGNDDQSEKVWDDDDDDDPIVSITSARQLHKVAQAAIRREQQAGPPTPPAWKQQIARLRNSMDRGRLSGDDLWPLGRQILYIIDVEKTLTGDALFVQVANRETKCNGDWAKPKTR